MICSGRPTKKLMVHSQYAQDRTVDVPDILHSSLDVLYCKILTRNEDEIIVTSEVYI